MYQVKVFDRESHQVIMESEVFKTLREADSMLDKIGSGEEHYSLVFKLNAVWKDLLPKRLRLPV